MLYFDEIKRELAEGLRGRFGGEDVEVSEEFVRDRRAYPLKAPLICVGYSRIRGEASGSGYLGDSGEGEVYGQNVRMDLALDIYVPVGNGGGQCHTLFSQVAEFFILEGSRFHAEEIQAGELAFDKALEAFHLRAGVSITAALRIREEEAQPFAGVEIVRKDV